MNCLRLEVGQAHTVICEVKMQILYIMHLSPSVFPPPPLFSLPLPPPSSPSLSPTLSLPSPSLASVSSPLALPHLILSLSIPFSYLPSLFPTPTPLLPLLPTPFLLSYPPPFSSLTHPLPPYSFISITNCYASLLHCTDMQPSLQATATKECLSALPEVNKKTLCFMCSHLHRVSRNASKNKMNASNLAIVFWPTFMRPSLRDLEDQSKHLCWQLVMNLMINDPEVVPHCDDATLM